MKKGKKINKSTIMEAQKRKKNILEFYYMTPEQTDAKELTMLIHSVDEEKVDVWQELNLLEVVLDSDSLIFQDGRECFVDPLDLQFIEEHNIKSIYVVSYEEGDSVKARQVIKEILEAKGGFICSDTEDFEPMFTAETIL
nr:hypothetical protein [Frisingicoccus sp.]